MPTWADVKKTIAMRLNRPNLDPAFIQLMAEERADVLASEGFYPSEQTNTTLVTQPSQYFYLLPRGTIKIRMVRLLITQVWIPLTYARNYEDLLISDPVVPPFTALPSSCRAFGRMLRIWPTPYAAFPLELTLDARVDVPSGPNGDQDEDSFWCNEGRALIVNDTCAHIAGELLRDPDRAATHAQYAQEAKDSLDVISLARTGPHVIRQH